MRLLQVDNPSVSLRLTAPLTQGSLFVPPALGIRLPRVRRESQPSGPMKASAPTERFAKLFAGAALR